MSSDRFVATDQMENMINETIANADQDVLATVAGFLFGGECKFDDVNQGYIFTPNEDYQNQFD